MKNASKNMKNQWLSKRLLSIYENDSNTKKSKSTLDVVLSAPKFIFSLLQLKTNKEIYVKRNAVQSLAQNLQNSKFYYHDANSGAEWD